MSDSHQLDHTTSGVIIKHESKSSVKVEASTAPKFNVRLVASGRVVRPGERRMTRSHARALRMAAVPVHSRKQESTLVQEGHFADADEVEPMLVRRKAHVLPLLKETLWKEVEKSLLPPPSHDFANSKNSESEVVDSTLLPLLTQTTSAAESTACVEDSITIGKEETSYVSEKKHSAQIKVKKMEDLLIPESMKDEKRVALSVEKLSDIEVKCEESQDWD